MRRHGVTLLEVLIVTAVAAVPLVVVMALISSNVRATAFNRERIIAQMLLPLAQSAGELSYREVQHHKVTLSLRPTDLPCLRSGDHYRAGEHAQVVNGEVRISQG